MHQGKPVSGVTRKIGAGVPGVIEIWSTGSSAAEMDITLADRANASVDELQHAMDSAPSKIRIQAKSQEDDVGSIHNNPEKRLAKHGVEESDDDDAWMNLVWGPIHASSKGKGRGGRG